MSKSDCEANLIEAIKKFLSKKHILKIKDECVDIVNEEPATNIIAAYLNKMCKDKISITEFPMKILIGGEEGKKQKVDLACLSVSDSKLKWVVEAKSIPRGSRKKFKGSLDDCVKTLFKKDGETLKGNIVSDEIKLRKLYQEIPCYYIMYVKRKTDKKAGKEGSDIHIDYNKKIKIENNFGNQLKLKLVNDVIKWDKENGNEFQAALLWEVVGGGNEYK